MVISGVVREYDEMYGLVAVRVVATMNDILCIAHLKPKIKEDNYELLKIIEKENDVEGYLDLDGKSLDGIWLDSISDESRF